MDRMHAKTIPGLEVISQGFLFMAIMYSGLVIELQSGLFLFYLFIYLFIILFYLFYFSKPYWHL